MGSLFVCFIGLVILVGVNVPPDPTVGSSKTLTLAREAGTSPTPPIKLPDIDTSWLKQRDRENLGKLFACAGTYVEIHPEYKPKDFVDTKDMVAPRIIQDQCFKFSHKYIAACEAAHRGRNDCNEWNLLFIRNVGQFASKNRAMLLKADQDDK